MILPRCMKGKLSMNTKRKKTAVFGNCFTSRYRSTLPRAFNIVAEELNMDLYYFNFLGKIGNKNAQYGDYEIELLDYIDLTAFDGIIFDGEGYNVEGMADKVIRKLRSADCAVVSISSYVEGFYNIAFDDASGLRTLEHIFDENAINIGDYSAFFMMVHTDVNRCPAFDSDYLSPTGNYIPAIWIDKHQEYTGSPAV